MKRNSTDFKEETIRNVHSSCANLWISNRVSDEETGGKLTVTHGTANIRSHQERSNPKWWNQKENKVKKCSRSLSLKIEVGWSRYQQKRWKADHPNHHLYPDGRKKKSGRRRKRWRDELPRRWEQINSSRSDVVDLNYKGGRFPARMLKAAIRQ